MFGWMRAAAAATALRASAVRPALSRTERAFAVRRLSPLEAAATLAPAHRRARAASLWSANAVRVCQVSSRYGLAARAAEFGRPAAYAPARDDGVGALWARLRAAGYLTAEETAARAADAARASAPVVRTLGAAPPRQRRAAWGDRSRALAA